MNTDEKIDALTQVNRENIEAFKVVSTSLFEAVNDLAHLVAETNNANTKTITSLAAQVQILNENVIALMRRFPTEP